MSSDYEAARKFLLNICNQYYHHLFFGKISIFYEEKRRASIKALAKKLDITAGEDLSGVGVESFDRVYKFLETCIAKIQNKPVSDKLIKEVTPRQLYQTLEELRRLGQQHRKDNKKLYHAIEDLYPRMFSLIKREAVAEIIGPLQYETDPKVGLLKAEEKLRNDNLEILMKNRQSKSELALKVLSVVSIFVGIGIFTTLGLVIKRLRDTGGKSANFFKPLSTQIPKVFNKKITDDVLRDMAKHLTPEESEMLAKVNTRFRELTFNKRK